MTLYDLSKHIETIALASKYINAFGQGDVYENLNSGDKQYPYCNLTIDNISTQGDIATVTCNIFYIDRLLADESNKGQIQSFAITALTLLINKMSEDPRVLFSSKTFYPFTEKFSDLCSGAYVTCTIEVPVDIVCQDDDFNTRTLTIEKNGTYSATGYDTIDANVHSDDVLNYFTLYPSNYFASGVFDPSTKIEANVKFTGDEDFYFVNDQNDTMGLIYNSEENETYAYWGTQSLALNWHKSDWEKGYYKIQFEAGRLQIGYRTWHLDDSTASVTPGNILYFGYKDEKTSPMEIEYITISASIGTLYDYRPKITEEKVELVEQRSGEIADIRTVYAQYPKPIEDYFRVSKVIDLGTKIKNLNYTSEICAKGFRGGSNVFTNLAPGANKVVYGMWISSSLGISASNYDPNIYRSNVFPEIGKDLVMRLEGDKFTYNGVEVTIPKGEALPPDNMVLNRLNLGAYDLKYCKIWDENGDLVLDVRGYVFTNAIMQLHYLYDNVSKKFFDSYVSGENYTTLEDTTGDMPIVFDNNLIENKL